MDERVIRSMARWPDVPAVFGWLALDGRGRWLLKGEGITNQAALGFIARNYAADESGRWYFQNGPQRVFVELHATPWIVHIVVDEDGSQRLFNHIEQAVDEVSAVYLDEQGMVLLHTADGIGQLDDRDLELFSRGLLDAEGRTIDDDALERRVEQLINDGESTPSPLAVRLGATLLPLQFVRSADLPSKFHFVRNPGADNEITPNPGN